MMALKLLFCLWSAVALTPSQQSKNPLERLKSALQPPPKAKTNSFGWGAAKTTPPTLSERVAGWRDAAALPDAKSFVAGAAAGIALSVALALGPAGDLAGPETRETREAAAQFEVILDALDRGYVDEVRPKKLMEAAVDGMLKTLDPYTEYSRGTAASDMIESVQGRYGGVGLVISGVTKGDKPTEKVPEPADVAVRVVDAYEGYSFEAGLRPRDTILTIGGRAPTAATGDGVLDAARSLLRGAPGTSVKVEYQHPWETETRETELPRFDVRKRDVELVTLLPSATADKVVAYARIAAFSRETAPELLEGLAALRYDGSKSALRGLVLDLRGNPGGLLDAAVDVASLFLPPDAMVVSAGGRGLDEGARPAGAAPRRAEFRSRARATLFGSAPLVVLVDGQSASASEIVAGAIQDYDAGVVLGTRTFGKGLIQDVSPLPFDDAALKVTVGRYYTPSGRCLQELDYKSERESLIKDKERKVTAKETFETLVAKRPIKSGGGVAPDVVVEPETLSRAETALLRSGVLDDFVEQWIDARPDVAKTLYERGREKGAEASGAVLGRADLAQLRAKARLAIERGDVRYPPKDDESPADRAKRSSDLRREVDEAFLRHPDRILSVADEALKERFFRSSALLKVQLTKEDKVVKQALDLLYDRERFDKLLAPPTKDPPKSAAA